jgi:hypothetical protein
VVLATGAMTDTDPGAHRHSLEKIFPRLGETATTSEILGMLDGPVVAFRDPVNTHRSRVRYDPSR